MKTFVKLDNGMLKQYTFKKLSGIIHARKLYEEGKDIYVQPFKTQKEDATTIPYFKIKGEFETAIQTYRTHCTNEFTGTFARFYLLERK